MWDTIYAGINTETVGWFMIIMAGIVIISLQKQTAHYGKHIGETKEWLIPSQIAWCAMESPNVIWCLITFVWRASPECITSVPNMILVGCFLIHYINRSFVYPFRSKGKPVPLSIPLLAGIFCTVNGYLQSTW